MICPACRTEYRPTFTHCSDCGGLLVANAAVRNADAFRDTSRAGALVNRIKGWVGLRTSTPFARVWGVLLILWGLAEIGEDLINLSIIRSMIGNLELPWSYYLGLAVWLAVGGCRIVAGALLFMASRRTAAFLCILLGAAIVLSALAFVGGAP